ncbi:hypothetical protein VTI74DRAFT_5030 [Chaetomium olivicolor]
MEAFYDMVQHEMYGLSTATRWRIVWEPEATTPFRGSGEPVSVLVDGPSDFHPDYPDGRACNISAKHFGKVDGPVLQMYWHPPRHTWSYGRPKTSIQELMWQVQSRFPMGIGLAYARRCKQREPLPRNIESDTDEEPQGPIEGGTLDDIEGLDRELGSLLGE